MKKRLGRLFILFILTGCTANYNLNIEGNTITENISGTVSKSEYEIKSSDTSENEIYSFLNNDQNAFYLIVIQFI
ncbi:MAG: hypothetical protein L6V91_07705 [Bacilli bacterium]|nr:MAG: hypothetical protein L6V91_07705 [Bacilli bacterium]